MFDSDTAGGNRLPGGGYRRTRRTPLRPHPVQVGAQRDVRGKDPDIVEFSGYIQAALLGRAVRCPVRAFYRAFLEAHIPLWSSVLPRAVAGAVPNLPA